jgi:hypothetical protein
MALGELPPISADQLGVVLEADIIREAAPGQYYVTPATQRVNAAGRSSGPFTPMRVALMMAVWLVAIAVPFLVWLIAR